MIDEFYLQEKKICDAIFYDLSLDTSVDVHIYVLWAKIMYDLIVSIIHIRKDFTTDYDISLNVEF